MIAIIKYNYASI